MKKLRMNYFITFGINKRHFPFIHTQDHSNFKSEQGQQDVKLNYIDGKRQKPKKQKKR